MFASYRIGNATERRRRAGKLCVAILILMSSIAGSVFFSIRDTMCKDCSGMDTPSRPTASAYLSDAIDLEQSDDMNPHRRKLSKTEEHQLQRIVDELNERVRRCKEIVDSAKRRVIRLKFRRGDYAECPPTGVVLAHTHERILSSIRHLADGTAVHIEVFRGELPAFDDAVSELARAEDAARAEIVAFFQELRSDKTVRQQLALQDRVSLLHEKP